MIINDLLVGLHFVDEETFIDKINTATTKLESLSIEEKEKIIAFIQYETADFPDLTKIKTIIDEIIHIINEKIEKFHEGNKKITTSDEKITLLNQALEKKLKEAETIKSQAIKNIWKESPKLKVESESEFEAIITHQSNINNTNPDFNYWIANQSKTVKNTLLDTYILPYKKLMEKCDSILTELNELQSETQNIQYSRQESKTKQTTIERSNQLLRHFRLGEIEKALAILNNKKSKAFDINRRDRFGLNALEYALARNNIMLACRLIRDYGADPKKIDIKKLPYQAQQYSLIVDRQIIIAPNVSSVTYRGETTFSISKKKLPKEWEQLLENYFVHELETILLMPLDSAQNKFQELLSLSQKNNLESEFRDALHTLRTEKLKKQLTFLIYSSFSTSTLTLTIIKKLYEKIDLFQAFVEDLTDAKNLLIFTLRSFLNKPITDNTDNELQEIKGRFERLGEADIFNRIIKEKKSAEAAQAAEAERATATQAAAAAAAQAAAAAAMRNSVLKQLNTILDPIINNLRAKSWFSRSAKKKASALEGALQAAKDDKNSIPGGNNNETLVDNYLNKKCYEHRGKTIHYGNRSSGSNVFTSLFF